MAATLKALDLFCGAGGVCVGLQAAGFAVTGVDLDEHADYPGEFVRGDVLDLTAADLAGYDLVWASPPCQSSSQASGKKISAAVNLMPETRELLAGHPVTIMENVPGALKKGRIRGDVMLSLRMFRESAMFPRRRWFELSFPAPMPPPINPYCRRPVRTLQPTSWLLSTANIKTRRELGMTLDRDVVADELRAELGAWWVRSPAESPGKGLTVYRRELGNIIPPEYSEWLGRRALDYMAGRGYERQETLF